MVVMGLASDILKFAADAAFEHGIDLIEDNESAAFQGGRVGIIDRQQSIGKTGNLRSSGDEVRTAEWEGSLEQCSGILVQCIDAIHGSLIEALGRLHISVGRPVTGHTGKHLDLTHIVLDLSGTEDRRPKGLVLALLLGVNGFKRKAENSEEHGKENNSVGTVHGK